MNRTKLVGIANITPDSFSDDGKSFQPEQAIAHIRQLVKDGADVIDMGAESTRPKATPISAEEEWQRLEPVLETLLPELTEKEIQCSIDTRHAETARKALKLGAHWINDVSALADDAVVQAVAAHPTAHYVLMHSLTIPADPAIVLTDDNDPIEELLGFAKAKQLQCEALGLPRERILFDPGIGFGKTAAQSVEILRQCTRLKECGMSLLIGHSRKSFLQRYTDVPSAERDPATMAVSMHLMQQEVAYLRVHNIRAHQQLRSVWEGFNV